MDLRCDGDVCSGLERQSPEEAMKCTQKSVVDENIDGCKSRSRDRILLNITNLVVGFTEIPGATMTD